MGSLVGMGLGMDGLTRVGSGGLLIKWLAIKRMVVEWLVVVGCASKCGAKAKNR